MNNSLNFYLVLPCNDLTYNFEPHISFILLQDLLKVASRRLLFDSKTHPLTFQGGGRFTNNLFLLFNDIFAHIQVGSNCSGFKKRLKDKLQLVALVFRARIAEIKGSQINTSILLSR